MSCTQHGYWLYIQEIERYITRPGQAVSYRISQLKFPKIRQQAGQKLGKQFDIRAFHDQVLNNGTMPLPTVEAKLNARGNSQLAAGKKS